MTNIRSPYRIVVISTLLFLAIVLTINNTLAQKSSKSGRIYVGNATSLTISVLDAGTNMLLTTFPYNGPPGPLEVSSDGTRLYEFYYPDANSVFVSTRDTTSYSIISTILVPQIGEASRPSLVLSPDGKRLYASIFSSLVVIDTSNNTLVANIDLGGKPTALAVNPSGTRVYVSLASGDYGLAIIDAASNTLIDRITSSQSEIAGSVSMAVSKDGSKLYSTRNGDDAVTVMDTSTNTKTGSFIVGNVPVGIDVNPANDLIYVATSNSDSLYEVNPVGYSILAIPVGSGQNGARGVAVNPSGTKVYVTNAIGNSVTVIDTGKHTVETAIGVNGSSPTFIAVGR